MDYYKFQVGYPDGGLPSEFSLYFEGEVKLTVTATFEDGGTQEIIMTPGTYPPLPYASGAYPYTFKVEAIGAGAKPYKVQLIHIGP